MSYSFNGSTAYASNTSGTPLATVPFSTIAWIKVTDTADARTIWHSFSSASANDYFWNYINGSDEKPVATTRNSSTGELYAGAASAVANGTWVMVHTRYSSGGTARYCGHGGGNEGTEGTTRSPANTPNRFYMGYRDAAATSYFNGEIGILACYNIELSAGQVLELLTTDPASATTAGNRVAYYDLRTDHGTTALTDSVGSYNLTLQGATKPTYVADDGLAFTALYLKLLAHSSAASATAVEGWVVDADNTTYYGKFTGASFAAGTGGDTGQAVLKVAVADFGGSALTTSDTPQVVVRNATYGTTMCNATVIEE